MTWDPTVCICSVIALAQTGHRADCPYNDDDELHDSWRHLNDPRLTAEEAADALVAFRDLLVERGYIHAPDLRHRAEE